MPLPPRPSSPSRCINTPSPPKELWRPRPGPPRRRHQSRRQRRRRRQRLRLLRVPPTPARPPRTSSTTASRSLTTGQAPGPAGAASPGGGRGGGGRGAAAMLGRAAAAVAAAEAEEEGRGRWVSLARSLALSRLLSLLASCVHPPSRRSPALPRSRSVFFGRHAEGKVRRRPPDPPRPPWGGAPGGAAEARGGPGCPCARIWQSWARLPVAWLRGRGWGRGPRTLFRGISSSSPALRGSELGGPPVPGSILSPGGGLP